MSDLIRDRAEIAHWDEEVDVLVVGLGAAGAIDCTTDRALYAVFTLGGLHTDLDGRVLDPTGDPIPGLFAAGRSSSGIAVGGYSSGLSLGDGTFFGRRAGRAAAAGS